MYVLFDRKLQEIPRKTDVIMTVYVLYLYFHKYLSCFKLEGFIFSIVFLGLFFIVALLKINNKVVITAKINIWFGISWTASMQTVVKIAPKANPNRLLQKQMEIAIDLSQRGNHLSARKGDIGRSKACPKVNKIKVIITMLILTLPTIKLLQAIYCIQKVAKVKKEAHKTEQSSLHQMSMIAGMKNKTSSKRPIQNALIMVCSGTMQYSEKMLMLVKYRPKPIAFPKVEKEWLSTTSHLLILDVFLWSISIIQDYIYLHELKYYRFYIERSYFCHLFQIIHLNLDSSPKYKKREIK